MKLARWWTAPDGVDIFATKDHEYVVYISLLDICNDGTGDSHGDKHYQPRTAYTPFLNADVDLYIVLNPHLRKALKPPVLGSLGRVTNLLTQQTSFGVWGEVGPTRKTGEVSHALGKLLHHKVTPKIGDKRKIYCYEMWPGVAAAVGNKRYHLISAAGKVVK